MKILVVDDEIAMVRLFEQRFRKELRDGLIQFTFAHSGEEALDLFCGKDADLVMILSDINMPGMNGLELLRQLRLKGVNVPVYMTSAYENEVYQTKSKEFGASGFIPKPLDFEIIRQLILDNSQGRQGS
jgi:CheY-like chemotaxis protein